MAALRVGDELMLRTMMTMQQGISNMRSLKVTRLVFALALCWAAAGHGADSRADPLLTQGVGIANCGKLANDLKPSQGLDHPPNYLLFYWVQGYVSGANFLLLNEYNNYVDMNGVEPGKILKLVFDFCKAKTPTTSRSVRSTNSSAMQRRSR